MSDSHDLTSPFATEPARLPIDSRSLPPSLQILLDDGLYNRMKQLAGIMAKSEGLTPRHLIGKPEACFTVVQMALDWRMNPNFVARLTYQTPGGSIGFMGALVQGALENSGRFVGAPEFEYVGNWQTLAGKFDKTEKGGVKPSWTRHDATGLGIIVRWQLKGEKKARVWPGENSPFFLTQCYPLNSPLWATDPKTQIAYLAIRRFANQVAPGILGAAAFDADEILDASERAKDVTPPPRPTREQFVEQNPERATAVDTDSSAAPEPVQATMAQGEIGEEVARQREPAAARRLRTRTVASDRGQERANADRDAAEAGGSPAHPLPPSGEGSTSTDEPTAASAEDSDTGDLPDHVMEREQLPDPPPDDRPYGGNDDGEDSTFPEPERDPFWDQERLYLAPLHMPKSDKTDWTSTYARLMELIKEAGSAGELMRFGADSRRTIQGVQLATKSTAVQQAIADRLTELPQESEDG